MDLDPYRSEAEAFLSALDREYYLHFSGLQDEYEIEPIYERHAGLFSHEAVERLREARGGAGAARGAPGLLEFAVQGLIGQASKAEQAELARVEAALEIEVDGKRLPFREAAVEQANQADPERRAAIESARLQATEEHLNPIHRALLERSHALATELGWPSALDMCEELSGIDLRALGRQTESFLQETEATYEPSVEPWIEEQLGWGFDRLRRSDLPAFFRAPALDRHFPADRLLASLAETLAGMGIDLASQPGVTVDTEHRPKKSPRAFCSAVRVPDEIYLVIARIGGRDDYDALFHEAGHAEHYAHMDRELPMEARYLGDNSVTEGFAFLFEHLVADPVWLRRRLGLDDVYGVAAHAHAVRLLYLRRYCGKLAYELALHDAPDSLDPMPALYSRCLTAAVHLDWPEASWLNDVDPFFYAARYLRAWALETHLRAVLRERFGEAWFEQPSAGDFLRGLWRHGQSMGAEELVAELGGARLDLSAVLEEV